MKDQSSKYNIVGSLFIHKSCLDPCQIRYSISKSTSDACRLCVADPARCLAAAAIGYLNDTRSPELDGVYSHAAEKESCVTPAMHGVV